MPLKSSRARPNDSASTIAPLKYALREALFVMAVWLATLAYTVACCYLFGYSKHPPLHFFGMTLDLTRFDRQPQTVRFLFGVPDWVLWGVGVPWLVSLVLTVWFCFRFMKDEELGEDLFDRAQPVVLETESRKAQGE